MRARDAAVGALVLGALLVGVQLGATTVGQTTGPRWSDPVPLDSLQATDETDVIDVAAAGGDPGAVAWLVREGDTWRISVARVAVGNSAQRAAQDGGAPPGDGDVAVTERWTAVETDEALTGLDVAVRGGAVAVVWERSNANEVALARRTTSGERTVTVSGDSLRVAEPTVAFAGAVPVVAWQAYDDGRYLVTVATVDGEVRRRTHDAPTWGTNSPTLTAADERIAVVWADEENGTTRVSAGAVARDGTVQFDETATLGTARPRTGLGSGRGGTLTVGGGQNATAVRAVWTDVAAVETATVREGRLAGRRTLGSGERPGVAVDGDRWLAAWLVDGPGSGTDVRYHYGGPTATAGTLSRLPSSARAPRPLFAPEPAVAWLERGGEWRVLVASHRDEPRGGPIERLGTEPLRFLFVAVAAALVGLLTAPVLPWSLFGFVLAFLATTGVVRTRASRAIAAVAAVAAVARPVAGTPATANEFRPGDLPTVVWLVAFATVETALLVAFLDRGAVPSAMTFRAPVAVSAAALVATVALVVSRRRRPGGWGTAALFVYFQSAALWATVLPTFA